MYNGCKITNIIYQINLYDNYISKQDIIKGAYRISLNFFVANAPKDLRAAFVF